MNILIRLIAAVSFCLALSGLGMAQKPSAPKPLKPGIFAVLNDGKTIEPVAVINKGKLENPVNGSDSLAALKAFSRERYKKELSYRLIFGGAAAGTAAIVSSDVNAECAKNLATIRITSTKVSLKGMVMGLATDLASGTRSAAMRRKPSVAEKGEIDALVKAEFTKKKLSPKTLRFQNLTAIDVNGDGRAEIVGSYWTEIDSKTRGLLFFIAELGSSGKYQFSYSEYKAVDEASLMNGDIKSVDDGVYHELLLDYLDVDGDGTSEIFTYRQGFEGAGFYAYRRSGGKWTRFYEFENYHCGF